MVDAQYINIDELLNSPLKRVPSAKEDLISDLCSVTLAVPASFPEPVPVLCSLDFGTLTESLLGKTLEVGVTGARLRLEPQGYNINKTGKFGSIEIREAVSISVSNEKNTQSQRSSETSLNSALLAKHSMSAQEANSHKQNYSLSYDHYYVKAASNNCWNIKSIEEKKEFLLGDYVRGSVLCTITPVGEINLKSLSASLEVTPSQISFKGGKDWKHHRLITALFVKRVREKSNLTKPISKRTTIIKMSVVEVADDQP